MEAFFSQIGAKRLFATYYEGTHDEGFVLCQPAPQDMMRASQSQIMIAKKLQSLGFPVLRFDYSGTGDSNGAIVDLRQWRDDILEATALFKRRSGVQKVSLIGTRLGATLALLVSQEQGFKRLILWDPVLDGLELLNEYSKAHHMLLHRVPVEAPYPDNQLCHQQSCGFPWPLSIQEAIGALRPLTLGSFCKDINVLSHGSSEKLDALVQSWQLEGKNVKHNQTADLMHWGHDRYMILQAFPAQTVRLIAQIAEGLS